MIIVERTWEEPNPRGGGRLSKVERKAFDDRDKEGINNFINAKSCVSGYEWTNVEYKYTKL